MGIRQGPAKHRILHSKLIMEEKKLSLSVNKDNQRKTKLNSAFRHINQILERENIQDFSYALNVMCRRSKTNQSYCLSVQNTTLKN